MSRLHTEIHIARPVDELFAFFARPENLARLTPPWLRLELLTEGPLELRAGVRLEYRLRVRGIRLRWESELEVWEPPHRFVDVQRRGPYRRWRHEHRFGAERGGTRVEDDVEYAAPCGWLLEPLVVRRDLERIFRYRHERLRELF